MYSTDHSQILKAEEKSIDWDIIEKKSLLIKAACESLELNNALQLLKEAVDEWKPSTNSDFYTQSDPQIDQSPDIAEC